MVVHLLYVEKRRLMKTILLYANKTEFTGNTYSIWILRVLMDDESDEQTLFFYAQ